IIIPAYNEEKLIADTLEQVTKFLEAKSFVYEIIVVDDGSKDSTVEIAKSFGSKGKRLPVSVVENIKNKGKGFSVRKGFKNARGEYACFSDADLSTPIKDVDKLLEWLKEGYDVAIGSRALKESKVDLHQPWWREIMGKTFNKFVQVLAIRGIKDTQCGFKCFSKEAYTEVFKRQTIDGFGFDVEALFIAKKHGFKIKEVPVTWVNRFESRVNPILHPIQMLGELVLIRFRDFIGAYK
ncbi:MAG: glycosyltransferase family 2 protein, partial [Proteobacteria bacterium]|nr:glycosyltransferase family 2 protein [Pseudomonadota bacterium]